jgi:hypothetical protein
MRPRAAFAAAVLVSALAALVLAGAPVEAEHPDGEADAAFGDTTPGVLDETPEIPEHRAFGPGEYLQFSVRYGVVRAGDALLQVKGVRRIDGHDCYHLLSKAESNSFFDRVHKVRDRVESFLDTTTFVSRRYEKHIREGKYRKDELVIFDQDSLKATYMSKEPKTLDIKPRALDVLAAFYYVRMLDLKVGHEYLVEGHVDKKNYPIRVKVHRRERVNVPAGTFDCLVVEPFLRSEGIFQQKGRMEVWVTDDARRMPVQMKSKVAIGWISCVLSEYRISKFPVR